jgi:hypothetical protein
MSKPISNLFFGLDMGLSRSFILSQSGNLFPKIDLNSLAFINEFVKTEFCSIVFVIFFSRGSIIFRPKRISILL